MIPLQQHNRVLVRLHNLQYELDKTKGMVWCVSLILVTVLVILALNLYHAHQLRETNKALLEQVEDLTGRRAAQLRMNSRRLLDIQMRAETRDLNDSL